MKEFDILLKREVCEWLAVIKESKNNKANLIFNLLLFGAVLSAVIFVLFYVFDIYLSLKIGYEQNVLDRQKEILAVIYFITLVVMCMVAGFKIKKQIATNASINALLVLPIKTHTIYLVKFVRVFFEVLFSCVVFLLSVTAVLCISCGLSFTLILSSLFVGLIIAFIAVLGGSILALPLHYFASVLSRHFVLNMAFYVCVVILVFWCYTYFLNALKDLLESGQIKFLLNQDFVIAVHNFANVAFPCNIFAGLSVGENVALNLILCLIILCLSFALSLVVVRYIFGLVRYNKLQHLRQFTQKSVKNTQKSPKNALIWREFVSVLRTPAFTLQYFAVAITLPLLVYVTATLLANLMQNLVFARTDFAIGMFCVILFSLLTNTFCASVISREGEGIKQLKILPLSASQILGAKIAFSCIVSSIAILLSCAVLLLAGVFSAVWQACVCLVVCLLLSLAEVLFAVVLDVSNPDFAQKSGKASNILIFLGLIIAFVLGSFILGVSLYCALKATIMQGELISSVVAVVVACVVCAVSVQRVRASASKKFKEISVYEV